ncbi:MAG: magnesium transporter, partial [Halobacteriaceae archaeon]
IGGLTLGSFEVTLLQYPSLLILVPVMIGTAGNLGSILSARMSTVFHLGLLSFSPDDEHLIGNTATTVLLAITVFPVVGAGGWVITVFFKEANLALLTVVSVALVSGFILSLLAVMITVIAAFGAYRFRLDPDDVVIPIVTNICDVLGVVVLFIVVQLFIT